ncbi:MAG: TetR family transcriptional regulator [Candidatus Cohnella colombiensis]|uniref:TetR family transcriptional regulator n=1 Tax=Candidatus Cohnella colombiensis TaxID=3121368 RepID=A0AA95F0T2_9BACL|nr:MAG: TetR family transcriptional regulator [Cohnella sp.]
MTELDKREQIIAAAYEVLSKKGYDRASTKEIANEAGVAQGLINYYFSSKDMLFAEVFRRETEKYCTSFHGLRHMQKQTLTTEVITELLEMPKRRALEDPDWLRLRYELFAIGLRNGSALPTLKEMLSQQRSSISDVIRNVGGFSDAESNIMAALLYSLIEGLGLQKMADPDFQYDEAYNMMAGMLSAFAEVLMNNKEK